MTNGTIKVYRVKSDTEAGKTYLVRYFPKTDKYVCECPAYAYCKNDIAVCKHIEKVKKYLDMKAKGEL
jgi:hypothetical protein